MEDPFAVVRDSPEEEWEVVRKRAFGMVLTEDPESSDANVGVELLLLLERGRHT